MNDYKTIAHPNLHARCEALEVQFFAADMGVLNDCSRHMPKLVLAIRKFIAAFADLEQDFEHVKEINMVLSQRFDDVIQKFPTVKEFDTGMNNIVSDDSIGRLFTDARMIAVNLDRFKALQSFRRIVKAVEEQNDKIRPPSFAESVDVKQVEDKEN